RPAAEVAAGEGPIRMAPAAPRIDRRDGPDLLGSRGQRATPEDGMREIERSGGSVQEAIEAALEELGVSEQEAHIEILQEPRGGFLGLNPQPAVVRVRAAAEVAAAPESASDEQGEL